MAAGLTLMHVLVILLTRCAVSVDVQYTSQQAPPEDRALLSRTLGSSMVLQRAPKTAMVWGYVEAGASVTVTLDGMALGPAAYPDANGTWRQVLPPTLAGGPHVLVATASNGVAQTLSDVHFGDVYLCGGQVRCSAFSCLCTVPHCGCSGARLFLLVWLSSTALPPADTGAAGATCAAEQYGICNAECHQCYGRDCSRGPVLQY